MTADRARGAYAEAAEEYFAMFRDFADVFQKHYLDRKDKPCKTSD